MFTVEDEPDGSVVITTMDEEAKLEDLEVYVETDGTVFIRQFSEELNEHQLCIITNKQLIDVLCALSSEPGIYQTELRQEPIE